MNDKDKTKNFLKAYAKILHEKIDIFEYLPLYATISMPQGGIEITTRGGKLVGYIIFDDGGGPSMPVGPTAMTFARLFVDLVNGFGNADAIKELLQSHQQPQ